MAGNKVRLTFCWVVVACACGQTGGSPLRFEVASVKPTKAAASFAVTPGGDVNANCALRFLITIAFRTKDYQISGGPKWVNSENFSVVARVPRTEGTAAGRVAAEDVEQRLQQLLIDRFGLKVHRETRDGWVYALIVAKNGPKLSEGSPGDFRLRLGKGRIANDGGAKVLMLANMLSNQLGQPVVDETGLTGSYKFDLQWTPDSAALPLTGEGNPVAEIGDAGGPALTTALQEQLGLRLERRRGPIEFLVIDHVEHPADN